MNERENRFGIEAVITPRIGVAHLRNCVPMVREVFVRFPDDAPADPLVLSLESSPPFFPPRTWAITPSPHVSEQAISAVDLMLDPGYFDRLTESESVRVVFTLRRLAEDAAENESTPAATRAEAGPTVATATGGGEPSVLAKLDRLVELLPRWHWSGLADHPALIAAFVQPNDPAVDPLLARALERLRAAAPTFRSVGYENASRDVWRLASALWSAVGEIGLHYALPPAEFEDVGQRVRPPSRVAEAKLATCLDSALLFASLLEAAGLHPLLIFTKGHAFTGLWLRDETFPESVIDDVSALRKRIQLGELIVFETTLAAQQPLARFGEALTAGTRQLDEDAEKPFLLAVDVRRARMEHFKPLAGDREGSPSPSSGASDGGPLLPGDIPLDLDVPDLPEAVIHGTIPAPPGGDAASTPPDGKIGKWRAKLLDLSKRNRLLNFKYGAKAFRLEAPDAGALEDRLAQKPLRLAPRPELMDGADPRSRALHQQRERDDAFRTLAEAALAKRGEVFVDVPTEKFESQLIETFRAARSALQEGGANTLFLAVGFLRWKERGETKTAYRAPLVLYPAVLGRPNVGGAFTLAPGDEEPLFNPTLIEMLRQDFGIDLSALANDLPQDDHGLDIPAIFRIVTDAVRDLREWDVVGDVALATFSFAKFLMWKDLVAQADKLKENAVVRHLLDGAGEDAPAFDDGIAFPPPERLDEDVSPDRVFCPLPMDSSQWSAVMAAEGGKNFVLIGPPGTGKSQTITNLIAQCLCAGKRVLFVSEKMTALEVVHRRLTDAGFGEFCLELHSNKAQKIKVFEQLKNAWLARGDVDRAAWTRKTRELADTRARLNRYVCLLHERRANGLSLYEAIGCLAAGADAPRLALSWPMPNAHSPEALAALREIVEQLPLRRDALRPLAVDGGPFGAVCRTEWTSAWQRSFMDAVREAEAAVAGLVEAWRAWRMAWDTAGAASVEVFAFGEEAREAVTRLFDVLAMSLPVDLNRRFAFIERTERAALRPAWEAAHRALEERRDCSARLGAAWSETTMASVRKALPLLAARRDALARLTRPWSRKSCLEFAQAATLLEDLDKTHAALSVEYRDSIEGFDVERFLADWNTAGRAWAPLRWWRRRGLQKQWLEHVAPLSASKAPDLDCAREAETWLRVRRLRAEADAFTPEASAAPWRGAATDPRALRLALSFQRAAAATLENKTRSSEEGEALEACLQHVADGYAGDALAAEAAFLREAWEAEKALAALPGLDGNTLDAELWHGPGTDPETLALALRFVEGRDDIRDRGAWAGNIEDFAVVLDGRAGPALARDAETLRRRAALDEDIGSHGTTLAELGGIWKSVETDPDNLAMALRFDEAVARVLDALEQAGEPAETLRAALFRAMEPGSEGNALTKTAELRIHREAWSVARVRLSAALHRLADEAEAGDSVRALWLREDLPTLRARLSGMAEHESRLRPWCQWRQATIRAAEAGLGSMGDTAGHDAFVTPEDARKAFDVNYARWWTSAVIDRDPVLRTFDGADRERQIERFRALDAELADLTRRWIRARLCSGLPRMDEPKKSSAWGQLREKLMQKRPRVSLRQFLPSIPEPLGRLAPCLLMSPLSVAQYLPPGGASFDVVVFDEASQIAPWDAVGAMARGRQVVMVGDPKQLPPTNFFNRASDDGDDGDLEPDMESVLDECMASGLSTLSLDWHYRSECESLIAFSNHKYYDGRLVTFPSARTHTTAVHFHPVDDGVFESGGARVNRAEARALVDHLVTRLRDPAFASSGRTVGVVTFNIAQQTLVEDLLEAARRDDPSLERFFDDAAREPVFVKNLENVQGDERDEIYFSITYGPDAAGKTLMRFGPLNNDGGERRLNVAVTRARRAMHVFSSLRPEQIDLSRARKAGARDLKKFLEYAERGVVALADAGGFSLGGAESPFEEAVARALRGLGWEVRTQIGASAYRIDLGVVHPDQPGRFLAGVECDGATYHRSATARDRDQTREAVLQRLGWTILRVWSTDWWLNEKDTLARLDARLRHLLAAVNNPLKGQSSFASVD